MIGRDHSRLRGKVGLVPVNSAIRARRVQETSPPEGPQASDGGCSGGSAVPVPSNKDSFHETHQTHSPPSTAPYSDHARSHRSLAWRLPDDFSKDEWIEAGIVLARVGAGVMWWIGD